MGQISSSQRNTYGYFGSQGGHTSMDLSVNELSYDRRTDVRYEGTDTVTIGTRTKLSLLKSIKGTPSTDFFKQLGIVVRTKGNRFARSATVMVSDYYRIHDSKCMKRNRSQGEASSSWYGEYGPAEASGALRIGDTLYAINGRIVYNKTRGQVNRMITSLISNQAYPLILTWKHHENINHIPWELETCMPPPEGEYCPPYKEWGGSGKERTSISI